jgi:hypothetical protein
MRTLPSVIALLALLGCAEETDLEKAFCAQLAADAVEMVTATPDATDAPSVSRDGIAFRIQLLPEGDAFAGTVSYRPDERGDFAIGLSADIPMRILNPEGEAVEISNTVVGASCPELAVRHTARLGLTTYTIELGPTAVDVVSLVSEESNDDL